MCIIQAIEDYFNSQYGIKLEDFNAKYKNNESYSDKKIWNITRIDFTHLVYKVCIESGYGKKIFLHTLFVMK